MKSGRKHLRFTQAVMVLRALAGDDAKVADVLFEAVLAINNGLDGAVTFGGTAVVRTDPEWGEASPEQDESGQWYLVQRGSMEIVVDYPFDPTA